PAAMHRQNPRIFSWITVAEGRKELRQQVHAFLRWLQPPGNSQRPTPAEAQRRYTFLRLKFNAVLSQFDIFADALTQRSEHETGIWLSGLDALATDALALPAYHPAPPVICYLDRGGGAAIRRARTRLPGGGQNPVAIIRMPRERLIGSGIASSLIHEVGHQAAALLGLVNSLQPALQDMQRRNREAMVWQYWQRCISEILSDFWSIAKVGVGSTLGLIGVVSLPRPFVFRVNLDAPHPIPWVRVKLSCAIGQALYPDPQWARLANRWESLYPTAGLAASKRSLLMQLEAAMPDFVKLLIHHRPPSLHGQSLLEAMQVEKRQPKRLAAYYNQWRASPAQLYRAPPSLVFAVIGQAKMNQVISPEAESHILDKLLTHWALRRTLRSSAICASRSSTPAGALVTRDT
uniref:hypothetical protein n=1 Tax=Candidatus Entotheonella palauensis TaxID=93172 RepID=UPI000B7D8C07